MPSLIQSALGSPVPQRVGGKVLTLWPGVAALVTSCIWMFFFLELRVGTFRGPPVPRCTQHSGALCGSRGGRLGTFIPHKQDTVSQEVLHQF